MIPDNKQLKSRARESLLGNYSVLLPAGLLADVIAGVMTTIFDFSGSGGGVLIIPAIITFILSVLFILLDAGFRYMHLQLARHRTIRISDMFHGYRFHSDTSILLALLLGLVNAAVIIPFTALRLLIPGGSSNAAIQILLLVIFILAAAVVNVIYSMCFFIFFDDPGKKAPDIMREGRALTRGNRIRLLGLLFSMAGWFALAVLSLGLGFLWVSPYFGTSLAHFYLSLRED